MEYLFVVLYFLVGFACAHFIWNEKFEDQYREAQKENGNESNPYACIILGFLVCFWPLYVLVWIVKDAIRLIKTKP